MTRHISSSWCHKSVMESWNPIWLNFAFINHNKLISDKKICKYHSKKNHFKLFNILSNTTIFTQHRQFRVVSGWHFREKLDLKKSFIKLLQSLITYFRQIWVRIITFCENNTQYFFNLIFFWYWVFFEAVHILPHEYFQNALSKKYLNRNYRNYLLTLRLCMNI